MKKAKILLMNWTPKPLETIHWAWKVMKEEVPDEISPFPTGKTHQKLEKFFREMIKEELSTPLEFVSTIWKLENVSRAFQTQLLRHRIGFSYSIQSMRVVEKRGFAERGEYRIPEEMIKASEASLVYAPFQDAMMDIQTSYQKLLQRGFSFEAARGILPLNIYSTVTFAATLRALINMMSSRLCTKVQGEFREVVDLMKDQIAEKMSPVIAECIQPPCILGGQCQMRMDNLQQEKEGNLKKVCPRYLNKFGRTM